MSDVLNRIEAAVNGFRADVDAVKGGLSDLQAVVARDVIERINAMEEGAKAALTEEQIRTMMLNMFEEAAADPDSAFVRKMRFPTQGAPSLANTKFARWGLSVADIEMLYDIMESAHRAGLSKSGPSQELRQAFEAISEAYYLSDDEVRKIDRMAIDDLFPRVRKGLASPDELAAYQRAMDSAESGFGQQLIGAQYVADLWDSAAMASRVFSLIQTFDMTAPTAYLPVPAAPPEMLFVGESTAYNSANYDTSKTGSNRVQVDAKKFVIHQMWSGELEEDSIIPFIPFLRQQAARSVAHYSDSLVLNGDTTNAGSGNINLDDDDPADTKHYLAFDGLRHIGLVDNTANQENVDGALSLGHFFRARQRMNDPLHLNHWGLSDRNEDIVHIIEPDTYFAAMDDIDEIVTVDKYGANATVLTGEVGRIGGHPIIPSQALSKTEADGKVSKTAANNTRGQVVTFNRNAFVAGWRRRVRVETERLPATDQTRIVYSLRLGFGRFSPTGAASGIEAADVLLNIAVD